LTAGFVLFQKKTQPSNDMCKIAKVFWVSFRIIQHIRGINYLLGQAAFLIFVLDTNQPFPSHTNFAENFDYMAGMRGITEDINKHQV